MLAEIILFSMIGYNASVSTNSSSIQTEFTSKSKYVRKLNNLSEFAYLQQEANDFNGLISTLKRALESVEQMRGMLDQREYEIIKARFAGELGDAYLATERFQEAIPYLMICYKLYGYNRLNADNLAYALAMSDMALGFACQIAKKNLVIISTYPRYIGTLAVIYFKLGRYQEALQQFLQKESMHPEDLGETYQWILECYIKLRDKQGIQEYKRKLGIIEE